ncbi:MAG: class I SAM-dependent methyltransferase, partial [Proteobacteria bacterium]
MSDKKKYLDIVSHYEACLEKHGDTHLGVDWPSQKDADKRYKVMLDVIKFSPELINQPSLLDFGCGTSHLYDTLLTNNEFNCEYSGLEISEAFYNVSRLKNPSVRYLHGDVLDSKFTLPDFDFIVLNGVFTEKRNLTNREMKSYFER